ncbi:MAG: hypothetical protein KDA95_09160, partial [Acidimicrobiales bacterium]|nr:hypothetical protein [Acidimicrobiales bacterium]
MRLMAGPLPIYLGPLRQTGTLRHLPRNPPRLTSQPQGSTAPPHLTGKPLRPTHLAISPHRSIPTSPPPVTSTS